MKIFFTVVGLFLLLMSAHTFSVNAQAPATKVLSAKSFSVSGPLGFIENKGQFRDQNKTVRTDLMYMLERKGMKVQIMPNHISFELYTLQTDQQSIDEAKGSPHYDDLDPEDRPTPNQTYHSSRIDVEFIGANAHPEVVAEEQMADHLNYFLSYTPVEGITDVKHYNRITYKNLYPNIDMVLIATPANNPESSLVYDFIVHPGGNVKDIKYKYHGSDIQELYQGGSLETGTSQGKIVEMIPESYLQNKYGLKIMPVDVSFNIEKGVIGFKADGYDRSQALVIDPMLLWATYCGGDSSEEGRGLATDSLGNVALIGRSNSSDNIATAGAYQTQLAGDVDVNIDKYTTDGVRIWGTYYGGSKADHGRGIVADKLNNFYVGCHTDSPDGCATPGAYRENFAGGVGDDGLLAYFNGADGYRIFGTYYGGTDDETIRRLAMDTAGDVIMAGYTFSDSGIATPGVSQTVNGGNADLCLSKWTPDGQLIWGTYLGANLEEHGRSVDVDRLNNIYVNGSSASDGLGTPGVSRPNHAGKQDYLLAKFNDNGQLQWFSYWGGAVEDRGRGVFVDSSGKYVYFTGYSASDTGVATPGAYQEHWNEGYDNQGQPYHDLVVMKWTVDGQIVWSSYLGGSKDDRGRAITMIGDNQIYISGSTESNDVMSTPDAFQPVWGGKGDMFLERWDSSGNRIYGSYFGGHDDDDNLALAIDDSHTNIYLIGTSRSTELGTPGTEQPINGGFDDGMLAKIQLHLPEVPPIATFSYVNVLCNTGAVTFTNTSTNADVFAWDFGDGNGSTQTSPTYTYASTGDFTVTLIATNTILGESDTISELITVSDTVPEAIATANGVTTFCQGGSVLLSANTGVGFTYKWKTGPFFIPGETNSTYLATYSGDYKVNITVPGGCSVTSSKVTVTVLTGPTAIIEEGPAISVCDGSTLILHAASDTVSASYQWIYNGAPISGATSQSYDVTLGGSYSVLETGGADCADTSDITVVTVNPNPVISLGSDTMICDTVSYSLDAGSFTSYLWSTGQTSQSIPITITGDYWVQVKDANGCVGTDTIHIEVTTCVGVEDISNASSVNIYPNPTSGNFVLSFTNLKSQKVTVTLENVLSQVVKNIYDGMTNDHFTTEINASELPSGIYSINIMIGHETIVKKLVIER